MTTRNGNPGVVLLVEDDAGDQELTRRALREDAIATDLFIVSDGEEAMDYLLRCNGYSDPTTSPRPELIMLDFNMPKLDGKQVLTRVRAHAGLRRIPVVVLTTSNHEEDIHFAYDIGCSSFITKPVDLDGFVATIRKLNSYWFDLVTLPDTVGA